MQEMQETWVLSLGQEDPWEEGTATQSSILAWRIPWTEEPGGPWGCKESDTTKPAFLLLSCQISAHTHTHIHTHKIPK